MRAPLPYHMFDVGRSAGEAKRLGRMNNIYHRGQKLAWDGEAVLEMLCKKHDGPKLAPERRDAARRVLGSIMWGELAAWKIAAQLADELEPLEARMAATSQAHDEARHFYVMHDYLLRATGDFPRDVPRYNERLIAAALDAKSVAKKLLGMQLQLESTALTIFHALREADICPVLTELLVYFEKDEARHVGLGTQLLPTILKHMNPVERVEFAAYSFRVAGLSIRSLKGSERDLVTLGIDPRRVAILGKSKQMLVFDELWQLAPGSKSAAGEFVGRAFDATADLLWPKADADASLSGKAKSFLYVLKNGFESTPTSLDPTEAPRPIPKG
jgi:hypothetical protein